MSKIFMTIIILELLIEGILIVLIGLFHVLDYESKSQALMDSLIKLAIKFGAVIIITIGISVCAGILYIIWDT